MLASNSEACQEPHKEDIEAKGTKRKHEDATKGPRKKCKVHLESENVVSARSHPTSLEATLHPPVRAPQKSYKDRHFPSRTKSNVVFYEHGNYSDYYGYRNKGYKGFDPRLEAIASSCFDNATCLDVGCNSGRFTLDLAVVNSVSSIIGVDIDPKLIRKAKDNLKRYRYLLKKSTVVGFVEDKPLADKEVKETQPKNLDSIVTFLHEDYTSSPIKPNSYDVITCMSVVKWIHINTGDDGLLSLFRKFSSELKSNGYLILESQPWSSYKPKKLSKKGKENYKKLKLRPENFNDLLSQEGFKLISSEKPQVSIGGFSARIVDTYQKIAPDAVHLDEEMKI